MWYNKDIKQTLTKKLLCDLIVKKSNQLKEKKHRMEEIKARLSKEVISQIKDKSIQNIVREIIFSNSAVKWSKVNNIINKHMPELTKNSMKEGK